MRSASSSRSASRSSSATSTPVSTPTTWPSTTARRSGTGPRRASSSPRRPSARRRCASARSSTACRSTTRCGSSRRSACSTTSATGGCSSAWAPACRPSRSGSSRSTGTAGASASTRRFEILLAGLASDELTHHGRDHDYDAVPMTLRPVQRPHPPLWFGISHAGRAEWAAEHEVNVVALLPAGDGPADHRRLPGRLGGPRPRARGHPVHGRLAPDRRGRDRRRGDERRAARLPPVVREHQPALAQVRRPLPSRRRAARGLRRLARRRRGLRRHAGQGASSTSPPRIEEAGINYFCADLIFGDITFEEASRTVELFESEIIPAFDPVAAK